MIKQNISYFKTYVALFIFLFVNFIFCIKYFSRITPFYMTLSLFFVFSYFLLWKFQKELFYIQKTLKYILTCYFIFCVFLFYKIPVESLNVDRWSVITSFWDAFLEGKYVYFRTIRLIPDVELLNNT